MTGLEAVARALDARKNARAELERALRALSGDDRKAALRLARDAGVAPAELARLIGVSRARMAQLLSR